MCCLKLVSLDYIFVTDSWPANLPNSVELREMTVIMPLMVTDFGTNRKPISDLLLMIV